MSATVRTSMVQAARSDRVHGSCATRVARTKRAPHTIPSKMQPPTVTRTAAAENGTVILGCGCATRIVRNRAVCQRHMGYWVTVSADGKLVPDGDFDRQMKTLRGIPQ